MDKCEYLIYLPEPVIDKNGKTINQIEFAWCILIDADILYNLKPQNCKYNARYCEVKDQIEDILKYRQKLKDATTENVKK